MADKGPLHIAYRPGDFSEFAGNEVMIESLKSILGRKEGHVRTFLFCGPSGCGKTTLARIIQNKLECSARDFHEFNMSNTRGIDTIRSICEGAVYSPLSGKIKIYLLDEVQKLTPDAQNALLKILEDTPNHIRFILCTTEPEKLLSTIRNRCTTFQVSPLQRAKITALLKDVCEKEKAQFPDKHLREIAIACDGSPRKALNILDQIIDIEDDEVAFEAILTATVGDRVVKDIIDLLMSPSKTSWKDMAKVIKGIDLVATNPEQIRYAIKGYFGSIFLNKGDERSYKIMSLFLEPFHYSGREGLLDALYMATKL